MWVLAGCLLVLTAAADGRHPVTGELAALVAACPEVGRMLEASLAAAAKVNPDRATNPVRSLPEYYDLVDRSLHLLPQEILENPAGRLPTQMQQGYCYLYFLIDQPLPELQGQGPLRDSIQYYPPFAEWLTMFVRAYGAFLDSPASWNEQIYQTLRAEPSFGLQQDWYESPANGKTYNRFFCRYLKSPAARPAAAPDDPAVVVAPADSVPQGVWAINGQSRVRGGGISVKVKLRT